MFHGIGLELIRMLAEGIGKKTDYFDPWFKDDCSSRFRAIHNLSRSDKNAADCSQLPLHLRKITTGEHVDTTFFTLLSTF